MEKTANGLEYSTRYYTPAGVALNLYTKGYTKEEIKQAKSWLKWNHDVVKFYINGRI